MKIIKKLSQIIFPNNCPICHKIIDNGQFCPQHWNKINFICKPHCYICHHPFEYKITENTICANCQEKTPYYKKLVASCIYNDFFAQLIIKFKFLDQTYLTSNLSNLLYPKLLDFIAEIDFIIAVPLHKKRLKKRKYNQALLLAKNISKKSKIKLIPNLLLRIKEGKNQIGLNKKARIKNVANAFIINQKYQKLIMGKNILIIDDVVTTGATIDNCSKILKESGANNVFAGVIAKKIL